MVDNSDPRVKVSVMLITYNHEKFIAQAIDSILMQEVNFHCEIVIGEDCSTDGTRNIVKDYSRRYPERIRLSLSEKASGESGNIARTFPVCRGQYIAMLDGDDYWTSPNKLQKQVDLLDAHPEYAMCFHNVRAFYEDGSQHAYDFNLASQKETSTLDDLWSGCFIATCSTMLRRRIEGRLPEWFSTLEYGDWPLYILHAQHGNIAYLNEVLAAYRIHSGGQWSGLSESRQIEGVINFYEAMNRNLQYRYSRSIQRWVTKCYYQLAAACDRNGNLAKARVSAAKCIARGAVFNKDIPTRHLFKIFLRSCFPISHSRVSTADKRMQ